MPGRIGVRPSAEPGVALLAPATSSTPWPRNTTLHSAAKEKPAHARGFQRTAALDARQAALASASMSLWGQSRPEGSTPHSYARPLRPESGRSNSQRPSGSAVLPSSLIDKYRRTMRLRQKRIDFAPLAVEGQRMCACFRWHDLLAAHRANIDDVYYPRIADGHVKVSGLRMQENHVGGAA